MASRANSPRRLTQGPRLVETVTSGDVVTMRVGERPVRRARARSRIWPKPSCVDIDLRRRRRPSFRAPARRRRVSRRAPLREERHLVEEPAAARASAMRQALERLPFVARPDVHRGAEGLHLRRRHQAGVVVLVAGERQAEALDRVGDEAGRPVVLRCRPRTPRAGDGRSWPPRLLISRASSSSERLLDQRASPAPWSPRSSIRRLRQAAPPWKVSAE